MEELEVTAAALDAAIHRGDKEAVLTLLRQGVDVNGRVPDERAFALGMTPLIRAIDGDDGEMGIVELLIEYGADVNVQDDEGMTPLMHSSPEGVSEPYHVRHIKRLIEWGADVNIRDKRGYSIVDYATSYEPFGTHTLEALALIKQAGFRKSIE